MKLGIFLKKRFSQNWNDFRRQWKTVANVGKRSVEIVFSPAMSTTIIIAWRSLFMITMVVMTIIMMSLMMTVFSISNTHNHHHYINVIVWRGLEIFLVWIEPLAWNIDDIFCCFSALCAVRGCEGPTSPTWTSWSARGTTGREFKYLPSPKNVHPLQQGDTEAVQRVWGHDHGHLLHPRQW